MIRPAAPGLMLLLAGLGLVLAALPAKADWYVSGVTYTHAESTNVTRVSVYCLEKWVGYRQVTCSEGSAWVKFEGHGYSLGGQPADYEVTVSAYSRLSAKLNLGGTPPPPRPNTWAQKAYINGTNAGVCAAMLETCSGLWGVQAKGRFGLMGEVLPTMQWPTVVMLYYDRPSDHASIPNSSKYLEEANWVARTTVNSYLAAWVKPEVTIQLNGANGKVMGEATSYATAWGILWP